TTCCASERPTDATSAVHGGDPGEIGDTFTSKFPSYAKPIQYMPDTGGPFNNGIWRVYERDYNGKDKPAGWGCRHRDTIWRRVPERDHWGQTTWVTRGVFSHPTMFSS